MATRQITLSGSGNQASAFQSALDSANTGDTLEISLANDITIASQVIVRKPLWLKQMTPNRSFIIVTNNATSGILVQNTQNVRFSDFRFDCSGATADAHEATIYVRSSHNVIIENCLFDKVSARRAITYYGDQNRNVSGGCVRNNTINCVKDLSASTTRNAVAIKLTSQLKYTLGNTPHTEWRATGVAAGPHLYTQDVSVYGNSVTSSYYGVQLSGCYRCDITGNVLRDNMRGISMQDSSIENKIRNNQIIDNESAGVHLAYGSSRNIIENNSIVSSIAHGEGMLQAYVGSSNNIFRNNITKSTSTQGAKYHAYTAVDTVNNEFSNNMLIGTCLNAYMGIEADWSNAINNRAHRNMLAADTDNNMAKAQTQFNRMEGNYILAASAGAAAIVLTALGARKLVGNIVQRNSISRIESERGIVTIETNDAGTVSSPAPSTMATLDKNKWMEPGSTADNPVTPEPSPAPEPGTSPQPQPQPEQPPGGTLAPDSDRSMMTAANWEVVSVNVVNPATESQETDADVYLINY